MRYNIKHMGFLKGLFKKEEAKANSLVNVKSPSGSLIFEFTDRGKFGGGEGFAKI